MKSISGTAPPASYAHRSHGPWTVGGVLATLADHEHGHFGLSATLAEDFLRDPDIYSPLMSRARALTARSLFPIQVESPSGGDNRVKEVIRKQVEDLYWDVLPEDVTIPEHIDAAVMEMSLDFLTWRKVGRIAIPTVHHLPLHGLDTRLNPQTKHLEWFYTDAAGKQWPVTPGDGTWVLHLPSGKRSFIYSALRALAIPFILGHLATRDGARYSEKIGEAILVLMEPKWASDDVTGPNGEVSMTAEQRIGKTYGQFDNLGEKPIFRMQRGGTDAQGQPAGDWDVKWVEHQANHHQTFEKQLERFKAQKNEVLLGRDPRVAGKVSGDGSRLIDGASIELVASVAEGFSTTYRQQIWKPFVKFNWGDRFVDSTPWTRWDLRPLSMFGTPKDNAEGAAPAKNDSKNKDEEDE